MRCFIRGILVVLALLVAAIVLIYLVVPAEVRMERSIVIDAPAEEIFPKVNNLKEWPAWSPWALRDPDMKNTYEGPDSGIGSKNIWESETQGAGSQTITESKTNDRIATALDFGEMGTATADFTFEPEGKATRVTWGMNTNAGNNVGKRIFNLFMEKMVGPDYESGLANLKELVEK